ncbi:hypothetical protein BDU57DRAFT_446127 [Ampelomyces quisqualis]|uniref:Uncharacterized protein n=1 Tax=Ampelomyces quisqualis TaxID=50730 RepID=A0A6A5QQW6_AMPQU|nr:hypothetical protein BDU57DRAFT_446127 [Ampelomyces quisqualis]
MALVTRILLHKNTKQKSDNVHIADGSNEQKDQIFMLSKSWTRMFASRQDQGNRRWVPTLSGIIKAGDEGLFDSALFANLHGHPGEISLEALYEVFADALRSRPLIERSTYTGNITGFLSSTKRVSNRPRRVQSMSARVKRGGQIDRQMRFQRKSLDISAAERGLARSVSIKRPTQTLVFMENGLPRCHGDDISPTSWMKNGQISESRDGSIGVKVTRSELAALSIILGTPLCTEWKTHSSPCHKSAYNISLHDSITEDGKHVITFRQHRRSIVHMPARGSGVSSLFAKHIAAGFIPYAQDKNAVHTILVRADTLSTVQAGSSVSLNDLSFVTPQSRLLASLTGSREIGFHIASVSKQLQPTNPLIDGISALPFRGGLVPLATKPLIQTVQFVTSGGLPAARLLQRLEGLVDKANKHAPHLGLFGPIYEPQNAAMLYRERERLGRLAAGARSIDNIADKASRILRYTTLLERLMAMIPDMKPEEAFHAVKEATRNDVERSYADAVAAHHVSLRRSSSVVDSHACPESDARSKRIYTQSPNRSGRSSDASVSNLAVPRTSSGFPTENLGKQIERILKAELPLSVKSVATVARLIIVAWTLSVATVAWEDGEQGFRIPDLEKVPDKMVLC